MRALVMNFNNSTKLYFTAGILVRLTEMTSPKVMWTLIMNLSYTEVKFYPDIKRQTGLNSIRGSCKRALGGKIKIWGLQSIYTFIC